MTQTPLLDHLVLSAHIVLHIKGQERSYKNIFATQPNNISKKAISHIS